VDQLLYGTTRTGGSFGMGTVFQFHPPGPLLPIPLQIESLGDAVVLSWTNAAFALQSAPTATGVFTNIPAATSPHTNAVLGAQQFFRLMGSD
jgi:uncharacterized repeat protein (TIGR03803 family)